VAISKERMFRVKRISREKSKSKTLNLFKENRSRERKKAAVNVFNNVKMSSPVYEERSRIAQQPCPPAAQTERSPSLEAKLKTVLKILLLPDNLPSSVSSLLATVVSKRTPVAPKGCPIDNDPPSKLSW
jgi:hypothetical protein